MLGNLRGSFVVSMSHASTTVSGASSKSLSNTQGEGYEWVRGAALYLCLRVRCIYCFFPLKFRFHPYYICSHYLSSASHNPYLSLSLFLSFSLSLFLYFSISLFLSFSLSLFLYFSLSLFLSFSLSLFLSFSLSLLTGRSVICSPEEVGNIPYHLPTKIFLSMATRMWYGTSYSLIARKIRCKVENKTSAFAFVDKERQRGAGREREREREREKRGMTKMKKMIGKGKKNCHMKVIEIAFLIPYLMSTMASIASCRLRWAWDVPFAAGSGAAA